MNCADQPWVHKSGRVACQLAVVAKTPVTEQSRHFAGWRSQDSVAIWIFLPVAPRPPVASPRATHFAPRCPSRTNRHGVHDRPRPQHVRSLPLDVFSTSAPGDSRRRVVASQGDWLTSGRPRDRLAPTARPPTDPCSRRLTRSIPLPSFLSLRAVAPSSRPQARGVRRAPRFRRDRPRLRLPRPDGQGVRRQGGRGCPRGVPRPPPPSSPPPPRARGRHPGDGGFPQGVLGVPHRRPHLLRHPHHPSHPRPLRHLPGAHRPEGRAPQGGSSRRGVGTSSCSSAG